MEPEKQTEPTFDLTITNGAAKRLQSLMSHFNSDETQVISLALELLSLVKDADSVQFKNPDETEARGVNIPKTLTK